MHNEEIILEPDPTRVMEGLRDTGYSFNTAMADLVDNSISAKATIIKVKISKNPDNTVNVYIADNGIGMDLDELKNAMRYGSVRRQDPSSLGKFGLGLKTASTAFCRCLSLLSKNEISEYHKVQWDLDEIAKTNKWLLLQPEINEDEIDLLEEVTDGKSGTLVIWDKVDRLLKTYSNNGYLNKAYNKLIEDLKFHFSMVYQRFLDTNFTSAPNVEIYVNDSKIEAWDPFCLKHPKTKQLAITDIPVEMPNGLNTKFHLGAYLLPRIDDFASKEERASARVSNDFEGFYVYRENRLIYFGSWLGMFTNDPHISLLRVDFSFDHTLDDAFNVDIKKSRILLSEEIFAYIKDNFIPGPKREAENLYRNTNNAKIAKAGQNAHEASNNNISQKAASLENSKVDIVDESSGKVNISNSQGTFAGTIKIQKSTKLGQCRVIPVSSIDGNLLWEPSIADGQHAVNINQSHEYYSKVYAPNLNNQNLITGMDALLWALSEAELSTYNSETKEQYEDMRGLVSRFLKKLVNDLPEFEDKNDKDGK